MQHITRLLTAAILFSATIAAQAQTAQKITATKANDYGLAYSLPNTAIDITIEVETTEKEPGELYKYARRYLNEANPITAPSKSVRVLSAVLATHGVVDPDARYAVSFKAGANPFMLLDGQGIPLAINTDARYTAPTVELPVARRAQPTPLETPAARQALSEEILQSQSTAKRAELVAAQIFALRQSRNDLLTGEADQMPPDGKAMELIMANIDAQEAALTAMFVGTVKTYTHVATVTYVPDGKVDRLRDHVVARVAAGRGVIAADDLSGLPVYLSVEVTDRPRIPLNAKGEEITVPKDALVYRLPATAEVTVRHEGETLAAATVQMAQGGLDYGMKAALFADRKAPAYAIFNPTTGAIVETGTAVP